MLPSWLCWSSEVTGCGFVVTRTVQMRRSEVSTHEVGSHTSRSDFRHSGIWRKGFACLCIREFREECCPVWDRSTRVEGAWRRAFESSRNSALASVKYESTIIRRGRGRIVSSRAIPHLQWPAGPDFPSIDPFQLFWVPSGTISIAEGLHHGGSNSVSMRNLRHRELQSDPLVHDSMQC